MGDFTDESKQPTLNLTKSIDVTLQSDQWSFTGSDERYPYLSHLRIHPNCTKGTQFVGSLLVQCLDNQSTAKSYTPVPQRINTELSLNRLFEIAKREHLKSQANQA
jgi:hypothetical protein